MNQINKDYQRLPGSYLFAEVKRRQEAYEKAHPDQNVIRLGVGDVTLPLAPAVIEAYIRQLMNKRMLLPLKVMRQTTVTTSYVKPSKKMTLQHVVQM